MASVTLPCSASSVKEATFAGDRSQLNKSWTDLSGFVWLGWLVTGGSTYGLSSLPLSRSAFAARHSFRSGSIERCRFHQATGCTACWRSDGTSSASDGTVAHGRCTGPSSAYPFSKPFHRSARQGVRGTESWRWFQRPRFTPHSASHGLASSCFARYQIIHQSFSSFQASELDLHFETWHFQTSKPPNSVSES